MSTIFQPPAPPRKRSRLSAASVSVSRSPATLFATSDSSLQAPPPPPHHYNLSAAASQAATATSLAISRSASATGQLSLTSHSRSTDAATALPSAPSVGTVASLRSVSPFVHIAAVEPATTTVSPPAASPSQSWTATAPISELYVPSSSVWSSRAGWAGRTVVIPSFIFPQSRSTSLHSLLSALRCVVLDEWAEAAVDLCIVDEEDVARELRARIRSRVAGNTASPPSPSPSPSPSPGSVGGPLSLSTTMAHLSKAKRFSVPVLTLRSVLSAGAYLLAPTQPSVPPSHATITLSSLSGSHAPFSRSFVADGSGLPSHPLLWLTAPKHASPFIRPRRVRGRQQQQQQLAVSVSAADRQRQQAEEAVNERERERTGRHTCEVCGMQFNGLVDAHVADAAHSRKQREQNWRPLVQLAQRLHRQRQAFDAAWSEQRSHHDIDDGRIELVSSSGSDSSSSSSGSGGSSSRVHRSPSGLCVWYSSHPPPARCFANWYRDDVLWGAPQHLHRTLALDSGSQHSAHDTHDTQSDTLFVAVEHEQSVDKPHSRTTNLTDQRSSGRRQQQQQQQDNMNADEQPAEGWRETECAAQQQQQQQVARAQLSLISATASSCSHLALAPVQSTAADSLSTSTVIGSGECSSAPPVSRPAADDALPEAANGSQPAARDRARESEGEATERIERFMDGSIGRKRRRQSSRDRQRAARSRTAASGPIEAVHSSAANDDNSRSVTCIDAKNGNAQPRGAHSELDALSMPADSHGRLRADSDEGRTTEGETDSTAADSLSKSRGEGDSSSSGHASGPQALFHADQPSEAESSPSRSMAVVPQRRSSRLERELVKLAQYDELWERVKQDETRPRTRSGRCRAEGRAAASPACPDTAARSAAAAADWLSLALHRRLTRTAARRRGQSGDELLKDAAQLDCTDLTQFMHFQCIQASKQRSKGGRAQTAMLSQHAQYT